MARIRRKVNPLQPALEAAESPAAKVYRAAGYVRLSLEDSGRPGGETLETQQRLVSTYIENDPSLTLVSIFCDNGHTGTDFERPQFERMMDAIRRGEINCVVVKDLSRFGRNYKETGNYLERVFPFLDVRFIAINDSFDTLTAERNEYGFIVPLKNLMNETYSRDISRKVSSAIAAKEGRGEFIGVWAPYGYSKSPENRHHLIVNGETAPVVREIFETRLAGAGYAAIARQLNGRGTLSPSAFLYRSGLSKNEKYRDTLWTPWNIKEILRNKVYLGHLVQGKRTNESYKQLRKDRYAPPEEWRVTLNTHEAIISEETFQAAQKLSETRNAAYHASLGKGDEYKTPNLFRGLVYCADCGRALSRRQVQNGKGDYYYTFLCLTAINKAGGCPRKNLNERDLLEVVNDSIRTHLAAVADLERRLLVLHTETAAAERHTLLAERAAANRELSRYQKLHDGLYQDFVSGLITRQEYAAMKQRCQQQLQTQEQRLDTLREQEREMTRCSAENPIFTALRQFQDAPPLTEELTHALIEHIEYHADRQISIRFRYQNEFDLLSGRVMEVTA